MAMKPVCEKFFVTLKHPSFSLIIGLRFQNVKTDHAKGRPWSGGYRTPSVHVSVCAAVHASICHVFT